MISINLSNAYTSGHSLLNALQSPCRGSDPKIGFMMTALLGGLSASLFKDLNPFVAAGQLTDSSLLLLVITACAMVSMISINLSNAYTGGYSLLNALPSLSRIQSALVFSVAGIILSSFPQLVYNAQEYISYLGILVIPISAIVVADYLVIRKGRISESALVRLASGESNFNREALVCVRDWDGVLFGDSGFVFAGV